MCLLIRRESHPYFLLERLLRRRLHALLNESVLSFWCDSCNLCL
jgi:hypothetical protein